MARPRKDQGDCAEQRIKDAFWALLEQNDLKDITVSMITSKANCNRGTFYYHFNSLEELVDAIITDELFINSSVPRALFYLLCKKSNPFEQENFALHIKRFGLMMNRGGQEGIDTKVKIAATEMWERLLCTNDEKLTIETRLIIEYTLSGLIGLISYLHREGLLDKHNIPEEMIFSFKTNSQYLLTSISKAQNIPLVKLEKLICDQMRNVQSDTCQTCPKILSG